MPLASWPGPACWSMAALPMGHPAGRRWWRDQRCIQAAMTPGSPDYGFGLKMGKTGFSFNTLETPWNVPVDSRRESLSHNTGQANTLEAFGLPEERNAALKDQGQSGG